MAEIDENAKLRAEILADMQQKDDEAGISSHPFEYETPRQSKEPGEGSPSPLSDEEKLEAEKKAEADKKAEEDKKAADEKAAAEKKAAGESNEDGKSPPTKWEKHQRSRERLEDIRLKAEADKAAAQKEREAAERAREDARRIADETRARGNRFDPPSIADAKFTPDELERAADWFETEAEKAAKSQDLDKFNELVGKSRELRRSARVTAHRMNQEFQQRNINQFADTYKANAEKVLAEHKEINDPETGIWKSMTELMEKYPILTMIPDGFQAAYEIADTRAKAGKADGLSKQLETVTKERDELRKKTSLETGDPAPIQGGDNFDSLPPEKQRAVLRGQAERADGIR